MAFAFGWNLETLVPSLMQCDCDSLAPFHMQLLDVPSDVGSDEPFSRLRDSELLVQLVPFLPLGREDS